MLPTATHSAPLSPASPNRRHQYFSTFFTKTSTYFLFPLFHLNPFVVFHQILSNTSSLFLQKKFGTTFYTALPVSIRGLLNFLTIFLSFTILTISKPLTNITISLSLDALVEVRFFLQRINYGGRSRDSS